jgi:hypothetical protein
MRAPRRRLLPSRRSASRKRIRPVVRVGLACPTTPDGEPARGARSRPRPFSGRRRSHDPHAVGSGQAALAGCLRPDAQGVGILGGLGSRVPPQCKNPRAVGDGRGLLSSKPVCGSQRRASLSAAYSPVGAYATRRRTSPSPASARPSSAIVPGSGTTTRNATVPSGKGCPPSIGGMWMSRIEIVWTPVPKE